MLTIKIITNYGGERVVEALSPSVVPAEPPVSYHPHLVYTDAYTKELEIVEYPCDAFIMNENGKTILTFRNMYPLPDRQAQTPTEN